MRRYKCIVEYDGTSFVGWQRQTNGYSVQEAVEKSLESITQEKIRIHGSGRTDTGVHAKGQVIHFDSNTNLDEYTISSALNHYLKKELISILSTEIVDDNFDARRNAILRTYEYLIINRTAPLTIDKNKAWHISKPLNEKLISAAIKIFEGTHDFTTFRAASCEASSPTRTIEHTEVKIRNEEIFITFQSRSFLQHQVRSMVGALKLIGEEKWSIYDLQSALDSKDRSRCAALAPACGLYLLKVSF
ncbi:tRNA pseudouridine(38-40) synthase TruA [Pelagibacteraceae bacterium]|jgi:tRNA pseudouridine38-40 synthase|nr:tRNA pseudouridine(38-40) synthase TruA [Pelagibacteraceae bacterium]